MTIFTRNDTYSDYGFAFKLASTIICKPQMGCFWRDQTSGSQQVKKLVFENSNKIQKSSGKIGPIKEEKQISDNYKFKRKLCMLMRFERTKINNSRRKKNSSIKRMQPINEEEMKAREKLLLCNHHCNE